MPRDLPAANLLWALPTKVQILVIEYTSFPEKREGCLQKIHNFVKGMSQDIKEERKVTVIYITGNIHGEREVFDTDMYRRLKEGDTLCVLDAGAYGHAMSSNYNCRLRPAEVLIRENGEVVLIRERDDFADLTRHQISLKK